MEKFGASDGRAAQDEEEKYLQFLLDEGLALLAKFQKIQDSNKRRLVVELVDALSDAEDGRAQGP